MDKWTPEEMLRVIDAHACTHTRMVPTQFTGCWPSRRGEGALRRLLDAGHAIHGAAPCRTM